MDLDALLALGAKLILAGGGIGAIAYGFFKFFGSKWLEAKFAERLQNLKAEQDQAIRLVQSTIDREMHRAKKLYDSEFASLTETWRLLRVAYDMSASTIASSTAQVDKMSDEELDRHLQRRGMEEWKQKETKALTGEARLDDYYKWSQWERYLTCDKAWSALRSSIDSNSIFFPKGFTEKFRQVEDLIIGSNVEFEGRIREYKVPKYGQPYDEFEQTKKLRGAGRETMIELEGMLRERVWSVAKDA